MPAYLDGNATAPVMPEVVAAIAETLASVGNPSSVHADGRAARARLERARAEVARLVGAPPGWVVFTSGGTEANALALRGVPGPKLVSSVEHASVLDQAPEAARAPVDARGVLDLEVFDRLLTERRPALVSVMLANNETGVLQPVAEAARLAHAAGALLHCDAVQGPGKLAVDVPGLGADLVSLSGHKFGGPPGTGALVVNDAVAVEPLLRGGGQERRLRAGTENLPGIVGFAAAAAIASADAATPERMALLRDRLEASIRAVAPDAIVYGGDAPRLPNTACVAMPGVGHETQLMALDLDGVRVSAGAACSSGTVGASHVLRAMGVGAAAAREAIRVSVTWRTTEAEVDACAAAWAALYRRRWAA